MLIKKAEIILSWYLLLFPQEKVKFCSSRLKDLQATSSSSEEAVKSATKVGKWTCLYSSIPYLFALPAILMFEADRERPQHHEY